MKTIALIITASLIMFSFVSPEPTGLEKISIEYQKKPIAAKKKAKKVKVKMEIIYGCKKKGCLGSGICSIRIIPGLKGVEGPPIQAIPYVADGKVVALEFVKNEGEKSKEVLKNLKSGYFLMEEKFSEKLNFKEFDPEFGVHLIEIPAGKLKAEETESGWMVYIP